MIIFHDEEKKKNHISSQQLYGGEIISLYSRQLSQLFQCIRPKESGHNQSGKFGKQVQIKC